MAKYSVKAAAKVKTAIKEMKSGTLRSGQSTKKITNPKQAVAIGLSEARKAGDKVPAPPKKAAKSATPKKAVAKKVAAKKVATAKKAAPKKAAKKVAKKAMAKK